MRHAMKESIRSYQQWEDMQRVKAQTGAFRNTFDIGGSFVSTSSGRLGRRSRSV
ncbi:hypothetical protein CDL15_Pgr006396 [Punica granatum]|uniref:Uncharacterized protein n=1 Tax=Punica granatum TaxID=22663 RepID=A0A218VUG1_PUNGR|nr:hypothetical protein CDL15_Pgr006396 [Punica granatum]